MIVVESVTAARLLLRAAENVGHDFHGNQWTDQGLRPKLNPVTFFHGTSTAALAAIKKEGLRPVAGKGADAWAHANRWDNHVIDEVKTEISGRKSSVYVTSDLRTANQFARYAQDINPGSQAVVLRVDIPEEGFNAVKFDEISDERMRAYRYNGTIPPAWIKGRVTNTKGGFEALADAKTIYVIVVADGELRVAGGEGSGNFGHSGRPGEVGGSTKEFSSTEAADAWGTKNQPWAAGLTPEEERALRYYTINVGINDKLRGRKPLDEAKNFGTMEEAATIGRMSEADAVKGLDSIFAKPEAILQEDVVTHRAWMGRTALLQKDSGAEFIDKGFTSTALVKTETEVFRTDPNTGRGRALDVEIHVPAGTRALYVGVKPENKNWYASSSELLLNRGTRYRIVSTDRSSSLQRERGYNDKARRVVLEVVK